MTKRSVSAKYMDAAGVGESIENAVELLFESFKNNDVISAEEIEEANDAFQAIKQQVLVKAEKIYADTFTQDELEQLTEINLLPIMIKARKLAPEIARKMSGFVQKCYSEALKRVQASAESSH